MKSIIDIFIKKIKLDYLIIFILSVLTFIFYIISEYILYNKPDLSTDALSIDLTYFYEAISHYAHFEKPYAPTKWLAVDFHFAHITLLADHFSPLYAILAPLLWIYNSAFMILVGNVLLIVLSIPFIYLTARMILSIKLSTLFTIAYICSIPIQATVTSGFYESVLIIPIMAISFYFYFKERYILSALILMLSIFVKEDLGLLLIAPYGLILLLFNKKRYLGLLTILLGVVSTYITVNYIIPYAAGSSAKELHMQYLQFYNWMGDTPLEKIKYIIYHPFTILYRFIYPLNKIFLMLILTLSSVGLCWLSPFSLILLANIFEKDLGGDMYSNVYINMANIYRHYSSIYSVLIFVSILYVIKNNFIMLNYFKISMIYIKRYIVYSVFFINVMFIFTDVGTMKNIVLNFNNYNIDTYIRPKCNDAINKMDTYHKDIPVVRFISNDCMIYAVNKYNVIHSAITIGDLSLNTSALLKYLQTQHVDQIFLMTKTTAKVNMDNINSDSVLNQAFLESLSNSSYKDIYSNDLVTVYYINGISHLILSEFEDKLEERLKFYK